MSEVQQAARVLEAEAKFTSLRCHRHRSASSVVMVTLVMREGLRLKAGHGSCEVVLGKQLYRNRGCHFPEENCSQGLELCDHPELNRKFSFSPTLSLSLSPRLNFFASAFSHFPHPLPLTLCL